MAVIIDEEFGEIILRRSSKAAHVRIKVAPNGRLRASLPTYAPVFLVKRLIASSRSQLRVILNEQRKTVVYKSGDLVGKSHSLIIRDSTSSASSCVRRKQQIIVSLSACDSIEQPSLQRLIRDEVIKALKLEARSYLPKRIAFLAQKYDYSYNKIRFSHAGGRWGSCNTSGTISLNIALMKLPFELIDYVIIHELSHTRQMNHSKDFWSLVAARDPQYKLHRRQLKAQTPSI